MKLVKNENEIKQGKKVSDKEAEEAFKTVYNTHLTLPTICNL